MVLKHMLFMMIYYGDKTSLNTLLRDVSENIGLKLIGSEADCLMLFPVHFFCFFNDSVSVRETRATVDLP